MGRDTLHHKKKRPSTTAKKAWVLYERLMKIGGLREEQSDRRNHSLSSQNNFPHRTTCWWGYVWCIHVTDATVEGLCLFSYISIIHRQPITPKPHQYSLWVVLLLLFHIHKLINFKITSMMSSLSQKHTLTPKTYIKLWQNKYHTISDLQNFCWPIYQAWEYKNWRTYFLDYKSTVSSSRKTHWMYHPLTKFSTLWHEDRNVTHENTKPKMGLFYLPYFSSIMSYRIIFFVNSTDKSLCHDIKAFKPVTRHTLVAGYWHFWTAYPTETTVTYCQPTQRNIPEECWPHYTVAEA
jgi:hypothetical protein